MSCTEGVSERAICHTHWGLLGVLHGTRGGVLRSLSLHGGSAGVFHQCMGVPLGCCGIRIWVPGGVPSMHGGSLECCVMHGGFLGFICSYMYHMSK